MTKLTGKCFSTDEQDKRYRAPEAGPDQQQVEPDLFCLSLNPKYIHAAVRIFCIFENPCRVTRVSFTAHQFLAPRVRRQKAATDMLKKERKKHLMSRNFSVCASISPSEEKKTRSRPLALCRRSPPPRRPQRRGKKRRPRSWQTDAKKRLRGCVRQTYLPVSLS